MKKIPMTHMGVKCLEEELQVLKTSRRPEIIDAIAEAREHGDLKENAEYHAAKDMQGLIEGRIAELEGKLAAAQVIDVTKLKNHGKVVFGATVRLLNTKTMEVSVYQIVGEDEADIKQGKISVASPIARALIGKEIGEIVDAHTPSGPLSLEIDQVEYI